MIILVCGYTSSGKSTVAKHLAKKLNYSIVHTSDVLRKMLTNQKIDVKKTKMQKGWYDKSTKSFDQRKKDKSFDKKVDKYLISLINKNKNIILDSSTLPYLIKKKKGVLRIWLKATQKKRAERMAKRNKMIFKDTIKILKNKDKFNISHYKEIYGFEFGKDLSIYDYVLDTTKMEQKDVLDSVYSFVKEKIK